jgi:hypothetical protein
MVLSRTWWPYTYMTVYGSHSWYLGQKYVNTGEQVHPYLVPTAEVLLW